MNNPFHLTRAADLNDEQIMQLWIDPEGELGTRFRPASQLPMILLGGKGSGKTHLMRYYSYAIQHLQHGRANMAQRVSQSGYLGVYARCSGLNAARFSRKRHTEDQWGSLFAYYLDIWLGQLILQTASEFLDDSSAMGTFNEAELVEELYGLFDLHPKLDKPTIASYLLHLRALQRELDIQINNASFTRALAPNITITPGRLIFGIPQKLSQCVPCLKSILFSVLIDEYENLYEQAQRYVNTLVRERENPVTLKIGAKLYGMRTYKTFSGDEELREGSEYELLNLDQALRNKEGAYEKFALKLCVSRVKFSLGGILPTGWSEENAVKSFDDCFEKGSSAEERINRKLLGRSAERPWISTLTKELVSNQKKLVALGVHNLSDINGIIELIRYASNPLIEKTNVFLLYRAWSKKLKLHDAATNIQVDAEKYDSCQDRFTNHWRALDKFRDDLRAQMMHELELDEFDLPQNYVGLNNWIKMSNGIARNFITTLKHVFDWASFHQEQPFTQQGVSLRSQVKGMQDSSSWFLNDARVLGSDIGLVKAAINRIASLMRSLRFSEKPPECSLSTFSVDIDAMDEISRRVLETAEQWSLLIRTADRTERNAKTEVVKYRINGMVAPKYDLPIFTRGSIHLTTEEANTIFQSKDEAEFTKISRARLARVDAPFVLEEGKPNNEFEDELGLF